MKQQTQEYLYIIKKENNRMGKIVDGVELLRLIRDEEIKERN